MSGFAGSAGAVDSGDATEVAGSAGAVDSGDATGVTGSAGAVVGAKSVGGGEPAPSSAVVGCSVFVKSTLFIAGSIVIFPEGSIAIFPSSPTKSFNVFDMIPSGSDTSTFFSGSTTSISESEVSIVAPVGTIGALSPEVSMEGAASSSSKKNAVSLTIICLINGETSSIIFLFASASANSFIFFVSAKASLYNSLIFYLKL